MIQIDMPMPENCRMCPACSEYDICLIPVDGKGFGEQNVSEFIDNRPNWCPLKEQDAIKPILTPWRVNDDGEVVVYKMECGKCGIQFYYEEQKYCSECGTPILWESR